MQLWNICLAPIRKQQSFRHFAYKTSKTRDNYGRCRLRTLFFLPLPRPFTKMCIFGTNLGSDTGICLSTVYEDTLCLKGEKN